MLAVNEFSGLCVDPRCASQFFVQSCRRTSTTDHVIPGARHRCRHQQGAQLALTYYYYPQADCTAASCALYVGFIASSDGANTGSARTTLAGPMSLGWLPSTSSGQIVGDYIATSFSAGKAYGFFAVAQANSGTVFEEAIYTTQTGFDVSARTAVERSARKRSLSGPISSSILAPGLRRVDLPGTDFCAIRLRSDEASTSFSETARDGPKTSPTAS